MYIFSIHYSTAPAEVRGKFAFTAEQRAALSDTLIRMGFPVHVILCTCNRTELFLSADNDPTGAIVPLLAEFSGTDPAALPDLLRTYCGDSAYRHLFKTASGLDSMIIGEDEILRQVRAAYEEAQTRKTVSWEINWAFQGAVACAKRIKTDTGLSSTPVSAATIAANEAAHFAPEVRVLMIGASGQIGSSTLKNLLAHKNVSVTVTARRGHAFSVPDGVQTVPYADRYACADAADCIISSTASPHMTLTAQKLSAAFHTQKPRLLLDLAVPADIDPQIAALPDIRLVNIDGFQKLAEENRSLRADLAEQARLIMAEEIDTLKKKIIYRDLTPDLPKIFRYLRAHDAAQLIYKMKADADSRSFAQFADVLRSLTRED